MSDLRWEPMPETESNASAPRPEAPASTFRAEGALLLLLTGLVLLVYGRLLAGHILFSADTFSYILGEKLLIREELLRGHLTVLNPYILCGTPVLANIVSGALYPLNVLLLVGSPLWGFHLFVVCHYLLAAWAMYALLRKAFRCLPVLAVTGAFAYCAGGYFWSMIDHLFFQAAPWVPLFFLALIRLLAAGSCRGAATTATGDLCNEGQRVSSPSAGLGGNGARLPPCCRPAGRWPREESARREPCPTSVCSLPNLLHGAATGEADSGPATRDSAVTSVMSLRWLSVGVLSLVMLFCCGNFQQACDTVFFGGLLVVAAAALHIRAKDRRPAFALCGVYVGLVTVAALLSMPQLLPTVMATPASYRATGISFADAVSRSFPLFRLIEFVVPCFFGAGAPVGFGESVCGAYGGAFPWAICLFVGIPLLAGAGLVRVRGSLVTSWAVLVLAIGLLLAFGRYAPFYRLAYEIVPGFNVFRYPEKYLGWVHFALVILGTVGLTQLAREFRDSVRRSYIVLAVLGVLPLLAAGVLLVASRQDPAWLAGWLPPGNRGGAAWLAWPVLQAAGATAAVSIFAAVLWFARRTAGGSLLAAAALGLTVVHLAIVGVVLRWTVPLDALRTFVPAADLLPAAARTGLYRLYSEETNVVPVGGRWREEDLFVAEDLGRYARMTCNAPAIFRLHTMLGFSSITPSEYVEFTDFRRHDPRKVGALLAVRYLILPSAVSPSELPTGIRILATNGTDGYSIVEDVAALPRIHLAQRHVLVAPEDAEAETFRNVRTDLDLSSDSTPAPSAVPPITVTALPSHYRADAAPLAESRLEVLTLEPGRISASCTGPTWLVVRDWFLPGWRAQLDRQAVEITRADAHLMAVFVPPGQHMVEFSYAPPGFVAGCGVAVLGLALGLVLVWGAGRWSRRRAAPQGCMAEPVAGHRDATAV
ncbi:MAG: hypothetical protein A3K19_03800 [Lentisphaerae bacterium RIFOXYB12_FULL_65_16]|nr:MAG: hypothetical protein A3K18_03065 [Lentisphaerae bacterium RIFOXYA12_64_32]OGV89268.1 MAG: hypothetical protein A3K19_03800 [Lentisphaerae bacterium RIFOXYB12_FULL_65_16]